MSFSGLVLEREVEAFLQFAAEKCNKDGVEIYLGKGKRVRYKDILCNGIFDNLHKPRPRLSVAMGKPVSQWLPIFNHELSHEAQWVEGAEVWKDQEFSDGTYAFDHLLLWCGGKEMEMSEVKRLLRPAREVERDCEARSLLNIERFDLPINPEQYAQKANSYLYFYTAMAHTRKWYKRAPYEVPEVWLLMPKRLLPSEEYDDLPPGYLRAFERHLF